MSLNPSVRVTLTETLGRVILEEKHNQPFREKVADLLETYLEGFDEVTKENPTEPLEAIAVRQQAGVDIAIQIGQEKSPEAKQISCQRGCTHCCHMRVGISLHEAHRLLAAAAEQQVILDAKRLVEQASWGDAEDWLQKSHEERRCVFLTAEGDCSVYEARPISCRKYFVLTPPEKCDIDRGKKDQVLLWFDTHSEIIASAVATHYGVDSLPAMLLQAMYPTEQLLQDLKKKKKGGA